MIDILIILAIGFMLGWWIRGILILNKMLRDPDSMINLLTKYKEVKDSVDDDPIKSTETLLNVERVSNVYYAYSSTGEFLAQGSDFRTMFQTIKDRFPNRSFRIGKYQPNLSEEEVGKLVTSVFEVFDSNKSN